MKKLLTIILTLTLFFTLTSCSKNNSQNDNSTVISELSSLKRNEDNESINEKNKELQSIARKLQEQYGGDKAANCKTENNEIILTIYHKQEKDIDIEDEYYDYKVGGDLNTFYYNCSKMVADSKTIAKDIYVDLFYENNLEIPITVEFAVGEKHDIAYSIDYKGKVKVNKFKGLPFDNEKFTNAKSNWYDDYEYWKNMHENNNVISTNDYYNNLGQLLKQEKDDFGNTFNSYEYGYIIIDIYGREYKTYNNDDYQCKVDENGNIYRIHK